jgi:hypothetical protein
MASILIKPASGPRIPSLASLACQTFMLDLMAAVERNPNPERFWEDPFWKAFRQSLQQVTLTIKEGFHSGK